MEAGLCLSLDLPLVRGSKWLEWVSSHLLPVCWGFPKWTGFVPWAFRLRNGTCLHLWDECIQNTSVPWQGAWMCSTWDNFNGHVSNDRETWVVPFYWTCMQSTVCLWQTPCSNIMVSICACGTIGRTGKFCNVSSDLRPYVMDTQMKRVAELSTDHHLVVNLVGWWGQILNRHDHKIY